MSAAGDVAEEIAVTVLGTILKGLGLPFVARWLAASAPEDEVAAELDAAYAAARALADEEARRLLGRG